MSGQTIGGARLVSADKLRAGDHVLVEIDGKPTMEVETVEAVTHLGDEYAVHCDGKRAYRSSWVTFYLLDRPSGQSRYNPVTETLTERLSKTRE